MIQRSGGDQVPQTPAEFYGEELKLRREAAGLTQEQLGEMIALSPQMISHFETGRRKPRYEDAARIDHALGTGRFFYRMRRTLDPQFADHFNDAAEAEQRATAIEEYAPPLVPGILQTEAYARAVLREARWNQVAADLDKRVANRIERSRILDDLDTPSAWAIMSENALRTVVGGPETMAEQLRHIASLGRSGRVLVQAVTHAEGAHATMGSLLKLMRFSDSPDVAYVEGLYVGSLSDEPTLVRRYRDAYDLTRAAALSSGHPWT